MTDRLKDTFLPTGTVPGAHSEEFSPSETAPCSRSPLFKDTGEWVISEEHLQSADSLCDVVREAVMSDPTQDSLQDRLDELRDLLVGEARPGGVVGLIPDLRHLQEMSKKQELLNTRFDERLSSLDKRVLQDSADRARDLERLQASLDSLSKEVAADREAREEALKEQRALMKTLRNSVIGAVVTIGCTGGVTLLYHGLRFFVAM